MPKNKGLMTGKNKGIGGFFASAIPSRFGKNRFKETPKKKRTMFSKRLES